MFDNWREGYKAEKKKLQGKTPRQKIGYIWDYYNLWIIGFVCLFCFGFFVIHQARTALKDHWLYLTITNTREDVGTNSDFWKGYVDYTGYDVTQKMVEFNDEIYFDYSKNKAAGNKYYEVFVATVDSGVLDAVTMEPEREESESVYDYTSKVESVASVRMHAGEEKSAQKSEREILEDMKRLGM